MARVTVEDCIDKVNSRFELVLLAAHRARNISSGASLTIDRDNDKNPVVALREIADETLALDELEESLVRTWQHSADVEDAVEYDENGEGEAAEAADGAEDQPQEAKPVVADAPALDGFAFTDVDIQED